MNKSLKSINRDHCKVLGASVCAECIHNKEEANNNQITLQNEIDRICNVTIAQEHLLHLNSQMIPTHLEEETVRGVVHPLNDNYYQKYATHLTYFNPTKESMIRNKITFSKSERFLRKIRSTENQIEKMPRRKNISDDIIPSEDFFIDLEDLSMKLRLGGRTSDRIKQQKYISTIRKTSGKKQVENDCKDVLKCLNFSQQFSPPILCNGKGRYFGIKQPLVGVRASDVLRDEL